ncbi:hypothetical protein [Amycolatopsis suaedae]|uniref:DUF1795 domain-containing protein n=1 Tax=Amycolatopsis suaedae TaxID=2510978 RepID=A0A4Q7JDQ9_9PSEU|nr:hypothetical protein [Amycolatopsis suaedae]RZQ64504.1 hypothetical protein EWH70_06175 [Amycolatopsis suaedae]
MTKTLPIPLRFQLPAGWRPAPPEEVGAPGAAFVALQPDRADGFVANITVDGNLRPDRPELATVADDSVDRLRHTGAVEIADRQHVGTDAVPGLNQVLRLSTTAGGAALDLVQCQVYLGLADESDPARYAVVEMVLTATPAQLPDVIDDFQRFVASVQTP